MRSWLLALVLLASLACGRHDAPPAPQPLAVDIATLATTPVVDTSEYLASLRSRTAAILQPQVDGQVVEIAVHPGEAVTAGQLLVRIDPGRQPSAVAQAKAAREARVAQLELAEANLARARALVAAGALPRQDLDSARATVESARGDVAALGAEITGNRVQLGYYRVVAPGDGRVGDVPVRVGDRVTPQTVITSVTDNSVLEANISVPVERAGELAIGTAVQLVDDRAHVIGEGTVGFISPLVNADTQSVLVKADIANTTGRLRAGQIQRANVVWRTHPGLAVPALAVTRQGGQSFVFVATPAPAGLVAKQRPVQLGALVNDRYVVTSGLTAGERIVTSAVQKLRDGAAITQAEYKARPAPR